MTPQGTYLEKQMFMLGYFLSASFCAFDIFCIILNFKLSVYPVCACVSAALILTPFAFQGAPGTINTLQPGPQV